MNDSLPIRPGDSGSLTKQDDDAEYVMFPVALTTFAGVAALVLSVIGVLGNSLTVVALMKDKKLRRKATTTFIISLAFSDLLFSAINLPLTSVRYFYQKWILGDQLCRIFPFFFYGNVAASLMSMVAVTINRFVIIGCYKYYSKIYTVRNVYFMIAALWIFSFGMIFPPLVDLWGTLGLDEATFSCTIKELNGNPKKFLFLVAFLLPSVVIVLCYSAIFYKIKTTRRKMDSHSCRTPISASKMQVEQKMKRQRREDIRLTKMMLTIFVLFIVCFLPLMLVNVLDDDMRQPAVHIIASVLAWMSAAVNPFIYSIQNQQYQKAFKTLLFKKRTNKTVSVEPAETPASQGQSQCLYLCCFQRSKPMVTPASSKDSVSTINIELKAYHNINIADEDMNCEMKNTK